MIDPFYRRIGQGDQDGSTPSKAANADQSARQSKFGALMYAMLKPPTLDLADANGDDDDAPRAPMKAHVQPNLAKLMQSIESGTSAQNPAAQATHGDGKRVG